jgi:hypothetical protein
MLQRGDIVVERLTGRRAIVIKAEEPDEVTCRFGDGRLEDRFDFELEAPPPPMFTWLVSLAWPFTGRTGERSNPAVAERVRPMLVRQTSSA